MKDQPNNKSVLLKSLAFLGLLVIIVYFNSFGNDFVSDDLPGILNNPSIGNLSHLSNNPLGFLRDLLYFFAYQLGGLNPFCYHLINFLFHLGSTSLAFIILFQLINFPVALVAASVFAVHPLQSEAVTWISGGPYPQYTFFFLASFLLYILADRHKSIKFYLASIFSFLLSLLSTEKGAVLPLILILYEFSFGNLKLNWKKTIPFFTLSILWFLFFLMGGAIGGRIQLLQSSYYQEGGFENPFIQIPIAISSYLKLIFIPVGFTLYHSEEMIMTNAIYAVRLGIFLLFLTIMAVSAKKNRQIFFWLSFFFISLWPVLTPLKISWIVAERYVYLGALGIYVTLGIIVNKLSEKYRMPKLAYYLLIIIVPILSILTIMRNAEWKNQDTLWLAAAKTSPSSAQNHNNLGDYYMRNGNYSRAVEEFTIATKLMPNYGDAYHNLANVYYQTKNYGKALENYQKAFSTNPNLWQSQQNIAAIYFDLKQYPLAIEHLQKAILINPNYSELHTVLGICYLQINNKTKAKSEFEKSLSLNPQDQRAKQLLLTL